jgi:guanylate kinase
VFVFAKEYFHPFNPTPLKYKPLIMVGPSGVGKNRLRQAILAKYGGLFENKISFTTRSLKPVEQKKENYYFVSREEFLKKVERNEFVEYCEVNGQLYGTTYVELDRIKSKGKIPIIEVDVAGAVKINERAIEGNFLFVYPPSFEELRRRLGSRTETEEEFKLRIQNALKEIELANNSVLFTNRLVNDDFDQAVD